MSLSTKWQKAEILSKIVGALVIPVVLLIVAFGLDSIIKNRELRANNFEIAVGILQKDPELVDPNIWTWASDTFSKLASVPPDEDTKEALENNGLYAEPIATFIASKLRAWRAEDFSNRDQTLKEWIKENGLDVGNTLFLIEDKYAQHREQFLVDQGAWE